MHAIQIGFADADHLLDWPGLAERLGSYHSLPKAQIRDMLVRQGGNTILSRLAWIDGLGCGVKTATIFPGNSDAGKPTVNGAMLVFGAEHGEAEAFVDFHLVTKWKTAGDSLLAAKHLARPDAERVLIVGAGTVARSLVDAYSSVFEGARFAVWNRTKENARRLAEEVRSKARIEVADNLEEAVRASDIVSCATMSEEPLIQGDWLAEGTHLDLIGAYRPDMREADDQAFAKSRVFVDARETTLDDIGELIEPLKSGAIRRSDVVADFYDLKHGRFRRESGREITLFKNGGGAHLDLMTARQIIDAWKCRRNGSSRQHAASTGRLP